MTHLEMIQHALAAGFSAAAVIPMENVVFDPSFRPYCEENLCGHYGANYSCPPDCGAPEEMECRMKAYQHALVFQTKWDISDYRDVRSIKAAKNSHNQGMLHIIERMKQDGYHGLMAGASSCTLCERCTILDGQSCRDPENRFSCLSAYCIFVKKLAEECNMEYTCADGKLAFFGLYAF